MGTKLSNVIGAPISPVVLRQLAIRAGRGSAGRGVGGFSDVRSPEEVLYLANKSSWARLISSVDLDFLPGSNNTNTKYDDYIRALGIEGSGDYPLPNSFAKNWILEAGTSIYNPVTTKGVGGESITVGGATLRQGLGPNGAYGLGGTEELGYRPMPGLTSITIDTTGRLGSLRTATVNFKVWNMNQLNAVEALYFRLGYSMLLEWGHTQYFKNNDKEFTSAQAGTFVSKDIYGIGDPFLSGLRKEKIQQLIEQKKFETSGNYDGMLGIVVNFNWSFNQDGGYDCMIRLVGLGAVISTMRINQVYKLPEGVYKKYRQAADSIEADRQAQLAAQIQDSQKKEESGGKKEDPIGIGNYPDNRAALEALEVKYDSYNPANNNFAINYSVRSARDFINEGPVNIDDYVGVFVTKPSNTDQAEFALAAQKFSGIYLSARGPNRAFVYASPTTLVYLDTGSLASFANQGKIATFAEDDGIEFPGESIVLNGNFGKVPADAVQLFDTFLKKEAYYTGTGVNGLVGGAMDWVLGKIGGGNVITKSKYVGYTNELDNLLTPFKEISTVDDLGIARTNTRTLTARKFYAQVRLARGGDRKDFYLGLEFKIPGQLNNSGTWISYREFLGIEGGNYGALPNSGVRQWLNEGAPANITSYEFTKGSDQVTITGTFYINIRARYKSNKFYTYDQVSALNLGIPVQNFNDLGYLFYQIPVTFTTNNPGFILGTSRFIPPPPAETKKEEPSSALSDEKAKQAKAAAEQIEAAQAFESALHAMLTVVQTEAQAAVLRTQDRSKIIDITSVTKLLYKTGILDGIFEVTGSNSLTEFNLIQYAAKGFNSQLMTSPNPKDIFSAIPYVGGSTEPTKNTPNFKQLCQALVVKYKQESTDTISITYAGDYKVYIPLGYLLAFINSLCLFYDSDNKDTTVNSQKRPYVYIDFNPETNFCLTSPQQFSIDPEVCLVPANLNDAQYLSIFPPEIKPAEAFKTGTTAAGEKDSRGENAVSKVIGDSGLTFKSVGTDNNTYRGKTMHIFVCTQYLLGVLKGFSTSDPQHAVALQPFLEKIMVDVNKALGNMNLFRVAYRDDSNTVQIQDDQYVPLLSGEPDAITVNAVYKAFKDDILQSGELPIFSMQVPGPGGQTVTYPTLGIAREMQLKTAMSSKMASMLAISAQASTGSVNATDHSEISWLNRNFKDRYKPYIQDVGSNTGNNNNPPPDGNSTKGNTKATEKKVSPENPDQKAANLFNSHVKAVYGQYNVSKEVIQLAKNYYIERMSKVKAADLITSAAPFIPAEMEVTLDGISGIVMGNAFNIPKSRLPYSYKQGGAPAVAFITTGLTHTIENNQWTTKIKGQMIKLREQSGLGLAVAAPTGVQAEGQLFNAGANNIPSRSGRSADGKGPGVFGYWGASPDICVKNAKGEIVPDDCYGGGQVQISPDTPGYPNVSINNTNVQEYFPNLKYERPNATSNINIEGIPVPEIVDQTNQNRFKVGRFGGPPQAFIVHHTAGGLGRSPISTFYTRGFPTQYWIDEKGTIYQFIPDGLKGQHIRNGNTDKGAGLSNSNTIGVEIAAPDCGDVTKAQKNSAIYLAYMLGFNRDQVFGHGEVNTHKSDCEGLATAELIRKGKIAT